MSRFCTVRFDHQDADVQDALGEFCDLQCRLIQKFWVSGVGYRVSDSALRACVQRSRANFGHGANLQRGAQEQRHLLLCLLDLTYVSPAEGGELDRALQSPLRHFLRPS